MPTTAVQSLKPSQLPLADPGGTSMIPRPMNKCPRCQKRCVIFVRYSAPGQDSILRERICSGCGFQFQTVMGLLNNCDECGAFDSYECKRSVRESNGVFRIYKCKCCGKRVGAKETFPIFGQEEKLRQVAILAERRRIDES